MSRLFRVLFGPLASVLVGIAVPVPALAQGGMAGVAPGAVSAPVLMYHRFGEDDLPSTNIRLDQLATHIEILQRDGHTVVPLARVVAALQGETTLPDKALAITVDDAFASVYARGWPALAEAGFPFTLFVSTEVVGRPGYMTWDQLRELRDAGVDLALHGHAHAHLPALDAAAQRADFARSLEVFERELGVRPTLYAYPFGEADATSLRLAEEFGFTAAFGQHSGVAAPGHDMFWLPRFALNESYGAPDRFRLVINALPLPVTDVVPDSPTVRGHNPPLYGFTVTDESLDLKALACYGPRGTPAKIELLGPRVEVRLAQPLPPGRARVNCTLPGPKDADGTQRWRWLGTQFTVPEAAAAR